WRRVDGDGRAPLTEPRASPRTKAVPDRDGPSRRTELGWYRECPSPLSAKGIFVWRDRLTADTKRKRILTGVRPTGALHLGHYLGALENWTRLQHEYDCQFLIADCQVSDYADRIPVVRESVWEVTLDWLAVGLDPETSDFVIES